jgi:hypothetical protein
MDNIFQKLAKKIFGKIKNLGKILLGNKKWTK